MPYRALADAVVVAHFAFVLFVVAGGLLVLRSPGWAWLHLPAALWGAAIEWGGWICPLTFLENDLRRLAGGSAYAGDFVAHVLMPVLYPAGLTREIQIALGCAVLAVNVAIYAAAWRHRRRPKAPPPGREGAG